MGYADWPDQKAARKAAATAAHQRSEARAAIVRLAQGTWVGHANPGLADWRGVVTADGRGRVWDIPARNVRVLWHAGTNGAGHLPVTGWYEATALTIQGECPDCKRPAHYYFDGNPRERGAGWYHDSRADTDTCWVGKAAFEAGRA